MPAFKSATATQQNLNLEVNSSLTINMPASGVQSGDYLVMMDCVCSGLFGAPIGTLPSGWSNGGANGSYYKLADGTENGTSVVFPTTNIDAGFGYGTLSDIAVVLHYRFQKVPTSIIRHTALGSVSGSSPQTATDTTATAGGVYEVRVYAAQGEAVLGNFGDPEAPLESITWGVATERAGDYFVTQQAAGSPFVNDESYTLSLADYIYVPPSTNPAVTTTGSHSGTGAGGMFLNRKGLRFKFSEPPFIEPPPIADQISFGVKGQKIKIEELPYHVSTGMLRLDD